MRYLLPFLLLLPLCAIRFDVHEYYAHKHFLEGMQHYYAKNYEAAIQSFFRSMNEQSRDNLTRYYLGMSFYKAGFTANAIREWENIIRTGGQDVYLTQKINALLYLKGEDRQYSPLVDYVFIRQIPESEIADNRMLYPTGLFLPLIF